MTDKELILNWLSDTKQKLIESHIAYGQKASGNFINSLAVNETQTGGQLIDGAGYAYYLEYGRGPTQASGNGSLLEKIKSWMSYKGLVADKNFNEYSITAKIHKEGTKLYRQFMQTGSGSGVITTVINDNTIKELLEKLSILVRGNVFSEVTKELTIQK